MKVYFSLMQSLRLPSKQLILWSSCFHLVAKLSQDAAATVTEEWKGKWEIPCLLFYASVQKGLVSLTFHCLETVTWSWLIAHGQKRGGDIDIWWAVNVSALLITKYSFACFFPVKPFSAWMGSDLDMAPLSWGPMSHRDKISTPPCKYKYLPLSSTEWQDTRRIISTKSFIQKGWEERHTAVISL